MTDIEPNVAAIIVALVLSATACGAVVGLVPTVGRAAVRLGVVDHPDAVRRIHSRPTPRAGGVAIYLALAAAVAIALLTGIADPATTAFVGPLFAGGGLLLVVGLIDDRMGLRPSVKLAAQIAASALALALGFRPELTGLPPAFDAAAFVLWTLFVTNSFNLIDGMDGLAASVGLVAAAAVAVLSWQLGAIGPMTASLVLSGALLGFLRHNSPPATIFLGDSGSLSIGFWLAALTAAGAHAHGAPGKLLFMACVLPVPVLDTLASVARRWLRHRPVFSPDVGHVHHRLLALGYRPRGVIAVVYLFSTVAAAFGVTVGLAPRAAALTLGVLGAALLVWFIVYWSSRLAYYEFLEAAWLLLEAPRRARVGIRNQILARDVADEIGASDSVADVRRILDARSAAFGFARLALTSGDEGAGGTGTRGQWLIMHPLLAGEFGQRSGPMLVVELDRSLHGRSDLAGVDRALCILVPALEHWLAEQEVRVRAELDYTTLDSSPGAREQRAAGGDRRGPPAPARGRVAPAVRVR